MSFFTRKTEMVAPEDALPGRDEPMSGLGVHRVLGTPIVPPFPEGTETAIFGMGCFWGADRPF
jgi:peptide-methionine (S)-S-oxide reductase